MLQLKVDGIELFDDSTQEFITVKPVVLRLEHSLVSLSKWEMKWKKPFLDKKGHGIEETKDYIRCMTLNQNVDPRVYDSLTDSHIKMVTEYIEDSHTATWFSENHQPRPNSQIVTSELIYSWMVAYRIPFETCQKWHLNRLLTLIRICGIQNSPDKKMSKSAIMSQNRALNAARRKKYGTKG